MNLKKFTLIAISITGLSLGLHAASALPNDISGLVDSAAPAVVNITSKKEVKMRNNRRGFDEFERFFWNSQRLPSAARASDKRGCFLWLWFYFQRRLSC